MRLTRCAVIVVLIVTLLGSVALAAEEQARAQIDAAAAHAAEQLRSDIGAIRISPELTIEQFIQRAESQDRFLGVLHRAQQLGGPRWIDSDKQICQVKLEISGQRIIAELSAIAQGRGEGSPVPAEALAEKLAALKERSFVATGSSISATRALSVRPMENGNGWSAVSDEERRRAIAAAMDAARARALQNVQPIQLSADRTVGDAIASEAARQRVNDWLALRPVMGGVQFRDDLHVELMLWVPPAELLEAARLAAGDADGDTQQWERASHAAASVPAAVSGQAQAAPAPQPPRIVLPDQPPKWVDQPIDASATAHPAADANERPSEVLRRTKAAAESAAVAALRDKVRKLSLTGDLSIGEAGEKNKALHQAVEKAMLKARVYKVEWQADGSATARVMLDSQMLWNELRQMPAEEAMQRRRPQAY